MPTASALLEQLFEAWLAMRLRLVPIPCFALISASTQGLAQAVVKCKTDGQCTHRRGVSAGYAAKVLVKGRVSSGCQRGASCALDTAKAIEERLHPQLARRALESAIDEPIGGEGLLNNVHLKKKVNEYTDHRKTK